MKEKIKELIVSKIKKDYKDNVDLLVQYGSKEGLALYFVPNNETARNLSIQFIIDEVGYDLFPISWERLTSIIAFDTPITYVVGNSEVVYSRDDECLARFNELKGAVESFVKSGPSEAMLNKAYEYLNDAYINLYNINLNSSDLLDRRIEATKIIGKIVQSVGYANGMFYPDGIRKGVKESYELAQLPNDYKKLIEASINSNTEELITQNIEKLLWNTRMFLKELLVGYSENESYDLMVGYYEEWKKLFNQAEKAINEDNQEELFMITGFFIEEIAQFLTAINEGVWFNDRNVFNEYKSSIDGLFSTDFFEFVMNRDYSGYMEALSEFEDKFVSLLESNDVLIAKFNTIEEFEKAFNEK